MDSKRQKKCNCVASSAPVKAVSTAGDGDIFDLSHHNLITVSLRTKVNTNTNFKHVLLKNSSRTPKKRFRRECRARYKHIKHHCNGRGNEEAN